MHSREHSTLSFALRLMSSACVSAEALLATQASGQRLWSDVPGWHSPQWVSQLQAQAWAWASQAVGLTKMSCLRIQIRQVFILLSSLVRADLRLSSADEQSLWLGLLHWQWSCKRGLPGACCKPLLSSFMIRFPLVEPHRAPCNPVEQDQSRASHKATHHAGGRDWSTFSFGGHGSSGETSPWCCAGLGEEPGLVSA